MTLFVLTAIELDADGRIANVEGAQVNDAGGFAEPPGEVPIEQIVFALERGDEVRLKLPNDADARAGPRVRVKNGSPPAIELEDSPQSRALTEMPRITRSR